MPPVTTYIEATETLMDFVVTKLSAYTGWTVAKFPGTEYEKLFSFIPDLATLSAVVIYAGSDYGNKPRRTAKISVIVTTEAFSETESETIRQHADRVISLLDQEITNQALFRAVSDQPVEIQTGLAAILINFEVQDH